VSFATRFRALVSKMNRPSLRVLHLEANAVDHDAVRDRIGLPGFSFKFERAANRDEFEAALNRGEIDLILADHGIPHYDGTMALESAQIRQPDVPYIIVSGSVGEDRAVEWVKSGARDFIHKDRLERLPGAILKAIRKSDENPNRIEADPLQAQKMELVGQLTGGIAHDFSNLLTIIAGYVSMMLDDESLPPTILEGLKRVFTASRQATGLVRQLLLFSRKRVPTREVIDLNSEVEGMSLMLERLLGKTIQVEFEPSPAALRVSADVGMLEQALMNLAVNARDAMPRGGSLNISLRLRSNIARPGTEALPSPKEDYACLTVSDNGSGIPDVILPRIFEPYFTTKEEGRGTGLAIANDIVKGHDGWIDVVTEPGLGTTFRIFLPITRAQATASPFSEYGTISRANKGTILLVEDETNVREFAAAVLQNDGYKVFQGKSSEQALEVWGWHSLKIDLLLTDIVLPGELSGPQLGARLLADRPDLRVVLTTGYSAETVKPLSSNGRLSTVLGKPYTPRTLLKAISEGLA
jgi:two-component system cell cycle sensor histidine kinase/response regulator CckA